MRVTVVFEPYTEIVDETDPTGLTTAGYESLLDAMVDVGDVVDIRAGDE